MKFNFNFFKKKKEESLDWIDETLKNGFFLHKVTTKKWNTEE